MEIIVGLHACVKRLDQQRRISLAHHIWWEYILVAFREQFCKQLCNCRLIRLFRTADNHWRIVHFLGNSMCIFRCVVSIVPWIQTRSKINTPQSIFRKARYFAQKSSYRTSREEPRSSRGTKPSVPAGVSEGGWHGGAVSRLQRFLLSHRLAVATIKTTRISCMHVHHPSVVPS